MAVRGKSINLFLMDGDAGGRIKCTLANWTGVAYKIPRTELDKCKERDDLKQTAHRQPRDLRFSREVVFLLQMMIQFRQQSRNAEKMRRLMSRASCRKICFLPALPMRPCLLSARVQTV